MTINKKSKGILDDLKKHLRMMPRYIKIIIAIIALLLFALAFGGL